jgi:tetratricopeptide (TPR) repeat protein
MNSLRQALDAAWQYYRRGEWQQAEQLYLQALKINPDQVDALHLLERVYKAGFGNRYRDIRWIIAI